MTPRKIPIKKKTPDDSLDKEPVVKDDTEAPQVFFTTDCLYALSINPMDKFQYFGNGARYEKFRSFVYEQLLLFNSIGCKYSFYIEVSEPLSNEQYSGMGSRLHLHGVIKFPTRKVLREFLLVGLYAMTRYGIYKIKKVVDVDGWFEYCFKQQNILCWQPIENSDTVWGIERRVIESVSLPSGINEITFVDEDNDSEEISLSPRGERNLVAGVSRKKEKIKSLKHWMT